MGLIDGFVLLINSCSGFYEYVFDLISVLPNAVFVFFVGAFVISMVFDFIFKLAGMKV